MNLNNQIVSDMNEIVNAFNEHFINITNENNDYSPLINTNYNISYPFKLYPCCNDEIEKTIDNLNSKSSNGYDQISAKFIKKYKNLLVPTFTKLINQCLEEKKYPEKLKIGSITPIYKNGCKQALSNYRPITKLSTIDKIYEEILLNRLKEHLNANKIIDNNQFGFVKNSNTTSACINLIENIYDSIENDNLTALLSIDLTKAFDYVDIDILLSKLQEIGIYGNDLNLFRSFLMQRKQFVQINNSKSNIKTCKSGVPQGSKIAATLFIIYINGIFKLKLKSQMQFYADDGAFIFKARNIDQLIHEVQHDLMLIEEWLKSNKLKLNLKKTKIIIFDKNNHNNNEIKHCIGVTFNNALIEKVETMKILGLVIDSKLNWNEHIKYIKKKLFQ